MKAYDANLLILLKSVSQFMVPIYQRVYSWTEVECDRLWADVLHAGSTSRLESHFTGSIVYVERAEGTRSSAEPDLIIDGQQRVTTVMLLLAALAEHLETLPADEQEPVEGFSPKKIRKRFLTNDDEDGDRYFKLILSKSDKPAMQAVIAQTPVPDGAHSRVVENVAHFRDKLAEPGLDLVDLCNGLRKLVVVDVRLTRGKDDPQLVFETMNSTGKRLSQADLIRNFVLMDATPRDQESLYTGYWQPMEQRFTSAEEGRFDEFVRHYLTFKTHDATLRKAEIYEAFKEYALDRELSGGSRRELVEDLYRHAEHYAAFALGTEPNPRLARAFRDLDQLRATVVHPLLLEVYADYRDGMITEVDVLDIVAMTSTYLLRRAVCQVPTNTHRTTFATFGSSIDKADYVTSIAARFLTLTASQRFPRDDEFDTSLRTADLYHFPRTAYLLRKLENAGRKEPISVADYTIEHIMPQNENLPQAWKEALGEEWQRVHGQYLHTLGNLTLTGYNSEYQDRPFPQKRDIVGGFRESPLRLNAGLGQIETWNEEQIVARGERLAHQAIALWPLPDAPEAALEAVRRRLRDNRRRFDWRAVHRILDALPAGRWTTYAALAEAVGTAPQPLANHVSTCAECSNAYRVLTSDGRVAEAFRWRDASDGRDPKDVLSREGVSFAGATADPEQKVDAEELLALADG
ncbi:hypothetical protein Y09_2300 [Brachybacterium sp. SW0106-09]|uniref:GmrSD restriction endonuclease domain-containing protein n=1 Tax=Brachybacterium sp. SW0106-09 TaxID=1704590 RepID=UPI0006B43758|nr:DUF262 domain-containing protein [Brachybacterium sp. SW0106-09]GAP79452.1 hypothetical protein Y09_2300 [Brachybacterium sp. SW0106-09]